MIESIWASDAKLPSFPTLSGNIKTDVLIIGGGLAGILCAYQLKKSGVDAVVIEADRILHGISRNTTAKITSQHGLIYHKLCKRFDTEYARKYWEIHEAALGEYCKLSEIVDCDFEIKDNYIYSMKSPEKLQLELKALQCIGIPADYTEQLVLPFDTCGAVRFSNQAQFHPLKFAAEIVKDLCVYERTAAREFVGNTVSTDCGSVTASKIIMATHFPILNKHGFYFLKMYQQRSYVLALDGAQSLDGMYLDEAESGLSFRNYGNTVLLGGSSHRTGKQGRGWEPLKAFGRTYYPDASVRCRWAAQDCMTLDGVPYIGQYSANTPNLYVATGFNKWGMTSSMAAALILADLVQGRENVYADVFSPSRTVLRPQLLMNGLEAISNILRFKSPRCPHLGCALQWNPQEHSWDCPCHGSRFSENGKLLDNPATGNLNKAKKDENI